MFKNVLPAITALFSGAKPCGKPVDFSWRLVRRKKRPFLLLPEKSGKALNSFELYSAHRPLAKLWRFTTSERRYPPARSRATIEVVTFGTV